MAVKAVPEGLHTITPHLVVNGATEALEFYKKAFGAQVGGVHKTPDGKVMHADLKIGDSKLFLADEFPGMGCPSPKTAGGSLRSTESVHGRHRQGVRPGGKRGRDRDHAAREPVLGRPLWSGQGSIRPHLGAWDSMLRTFRPRRWSAVPAKPLLRWRRADSRPKPKFSTYTTSRQGRPFLAEVVPSQIIQSGDLMSNSQATPADAELILKLVRSSP